MDPELKEFLEEYYRPRASSEAVEVAVVGNQSLKEVAFRLLDTRRLKHLTQGQLAQQCGTTQPVIARLESGRANPRLRTLLQVCAVLELKLSLK